MQLRRLEIANVRLAQFTPRLAQALSQLSHLSCSGATCCCGVAKPLTARSVPAARAPHWETHPPITHICPAAYAAAADVLAARPRRRAGIQLWQGLRHLASLRELRLEHQSGAGMPANALACTGLRGLTLLSSSAKDWPLALHQLSEWLRAA